MPLSCASAHNNPRILRRRTLNRASSAADVWGDEPAMAASKTKSNGKVHKADAPRGAAAPAPGARLAAAFEAVEKFPALIESRARVMRAATAETARVGELVEAV